MSIQSVHSCFLTLVSVSLAAGENKVTVRTDFPGGNVLVERQEGNTVHLAPDLRGGPAWFYWHFEAEASGPGTVRFSFAKPPLIGVRGPAISQDGGKSWRWLGADQVQYAPPADKDKKIPRHDVFAFTFTEAKQKVRFAVAIPYLQRELDEFLGKHKTNPHLARSVLTQSRLGRRTVDLVQIGKPGLGIEPVLMTARHHACESMASYVLEGFMREAISDSPAGAAFRKRHVLYAVPIIDKDGVEMGDQGKNRLPRDYNRDYGKDAIYPEIKAIMELADLKKVHFSLDLHCPFLKGDIHEAFYFLGVAHPHNLRNLHAWSAWLKEERPQSVMVPLNLMKDASKGVDGTINSHYFASRPGMIFAACLEVPYTQLNVALDADMARAYGAAMLRAWVRTTFVTAKAEGPPHEDVHARLLEFRSVFLKAYRAKPKEMETAAQAHLASSEAPDVLRAEANNLMAVLRLHQKRFADARRHAENVRDEGATAYQREIAAGLLVQIVCTDPKSAASDVEASVEDWLKAPYPALDQKAKVYQAAAEFYQAKAAHEKSLGYLRKQFAVVPGYEKGKLLNRVAAAQDALKRPDEALATRQEAVAFLRARLSPKPERSVFGAGMTVDLFEALTLIPIATLEEKRAAAEMVLQHDVVAAAVKERVRKHLAELERK